MADTRSIFQKLSDGGKKFLNDKVIPGLHKNPHHYEHEGQDIGRRNGLILPLALLWVTLLNKTFDAFVTKHPLLFTGVCVTSIFYGSSIGKKKTGSNFNKKVMH